MVVYCKGKYLIVANNHNSEIHFGAFSQPYLTVFVSSASQQDSSHIDHLNI